MLALPGNVRAKGKRPRVEHAAPAFYASSYSNSNTEASRIKSRISIIAGIIRQNWTRRQNYLACFRVNRNLTCCLVLLKLLVPATKRFERIILQHFKNALWSSFSNFVLEKKNKYTGPEQVSKFLKHCEKKTKLSEISIWVKKKFLLIKPVQFQCVGVVDL